jgi:hypothetical protein
LRRKEEEEEEEDEQRKREFKSDNMDFEKMEKLHLFFLLVESYKPHCQPMSIQPNYSVFSNNRSTQCPIFLRMSRLHPCLLLTPALHSMGKNNTSFGLCATDTFSLARTNVQLAS